MSDLEELQHHQTEVMVTSKGGSLSRWDSNTGCGNDSKQCYICFESFVVGESVSWTKDDNNLCQHCFHSHCIMHWLENHNDCPCCREAIIHDPPPNLISWSPGRKIWRFPWHQKGDVHNETNKARARYCVRHGLVLPSSTEKCYDVAVMG